MKNYGGHTMNKLTKIIIGAWHGGVAAAATAHDLKSMECMIDLHLKGQRDCEGGQYVSLRMNEARELGLWLTRRTIKYSVYTAMPQPVRKFWDRMNAKRIALEIKM